MPQLSIEIRNLIYDIHGVSTGMISVLLCILYRKKYHFDLKSSVLINFVWFWLVFSNASRMWTALDAMVLGYSSVSAFRSILILPPVAWVLGKLLKRRTMDICDYVTPFYFFCHGFATIACWICGCCAGREWALGIINPKSGLTVFPFQPLNILFCMITFVVTLMYAKKHGYKTRGKTYALGMIVYGCFRYGLELFSDDPRIIWVLSLYSLCAIAMVIVGLLMLYFIDNPVRQNPHND